MGDADDIQRIEAELTFIQNEIDRRHSRVDDDFERQRNLDKIDELRTRKTQLSERLQKLQTH